MTKFRNVKRILIIWGIVVLIILALGLILRAYFLTREESVEVKDSLKKLNTPLEIRSFEKFTQEQVNYLPITTLEYSNPEIQWLSLKTGNLIYIGYLNKEIKFNLKYATNINALDFRIYDDGKLLYYINNESGQLPKLVLQTKDNLYEIASLNSTEYFISYYYSAEEKLFYISKGNNLDIYTIFTYRPGGEIQELFQGYDKFSILKARSNDLVLKKNNTCSSLDYLTKMLSTIDCSLISLNEANINLLDNEFEIKLKKDIEQKVIYSVSNYERITGTTFSQGNIYFGLKPNIASYPTSYSSLDTNVYKSDLNGTLSLLAKVSIIGDPKNIFQIDSSLVIIHGYYGLVEIISLDTSRPISYNDNWKNITLLNDDIIEIGILAQDY